MTPVGGDTPVPGSPSHSASHDSSALLPETIGHYSHTHTLTHNHISLIHYLRIHTRGVAHQKVSEWSVDGVEADVPQ